MSSWRQSNVVIITPVAGAGTNWFPLCLAGWLQYPEVEAPKVCLYLPPPPPPPVAELSRQQAGRAGPSIILWGSHLHTRPGQGIKLSAPQDSHLGTHQHHTGIRIHHRQCEGKSFTEITNTMENWSHWLFSHSRTHHQTDRTEQLSRLRKWSGSNQNGETLYHLVWDCYRSHTNTTFIRLLVLHQNENISLSCFGPWTSAIVLVHVFWKLWNGNFPHCYGLLVNIQNKKHVSKNQKTPVFEPNPSLGRMCRVAWGKGSLFMLCDMTRQGY